MDSRIATQVIEILETPKPPCVVLVAAAPSEFNNFRWRLRLGPLREGVVVHVRGTKMKTRTSLYDEMAAAFQFPWYFGENGNALDECMRDLDWMPGNFYVLGIRDALSVLSEAASDLAWFGRHLAFICEEWAKPVAQGQPFDRPAIPFHVVLQCLPGQEQATLRRFKEAGADVVLVSVESPP